MTNPNGKLVIFVDLNEAAYVAHSAFQANGAVFDPATRKFVYNVLEPLDAIAEADVGTAAPGVISLKGPQPARPLRLAMGAHMALLKV